MMPRGALLMMAFALAGVCGADVGGGRGHPATPWRIAAPANTAELEAARKEAAEVQTLTLAGTLAGQRDAEFAQIRNVRLIPQVKKEGDVPSYEFKGRNAAGKKVSVSFANVERFVVKAKSDDTITLTVTVWPDISAKDLLARQPTWKQLHDGFRREVQIEIPIEFEGRALEFAGDGRGFAIETLPEGAKVDFHGGDPRRVNPRSFWWAIPSVTKDADYPYRMMPAA